MGSMLTGLCQKRQSRQRWTKCHVLSARPHRAFKDGGYRPLQSSPGVYNEDMCKGLDFVISEAKKSRLRLILSLVNNFKGKKQYVEWAKQQGENLTSEDGFYTNYLVKTFYKSHVKVTIIIIRYKHLLMHDKHVIQCACTV
ncbi:putative mannan endo-1,4-beta-mannosidase [Dioscorea sansibarensis]